MTSYLDHVTEFQIKLISLVLPRVPAITIWGGFTPHLLASRRVQISNILIHHHLKMSLVLSMKIRSNTLILHLKVVNFVGIPYVSQIFTQYACIPLADKCLMEDKMFHLNIYLVTRYYFVSLTKQLSNF